MQAVKNGIKCTLRTPGKAALFALILAVLSALVSVAYCGFSAVNGYLNDANEYFHTIAELEFIGEDYPDRNVFDPAMSASIEANAEELAALARDPAVISYEPDSPNLALIEGLRRRDDYVYNPNAAVLALYIMNEVSPGKLYVGIVDREFSSVKKTEGKLIVIRLEEDAEHAELPETGKTYVMAGNYYRGDSANICFQQLAVGFEDRFGRAETPDLERIVSFDLAEDDPFYRLAEVLNIQNNACRVTYTNSITDLSPFHQQQMKLASGRFFTEEEYRTAAHSVILSDKTAGALGLSVGDKLDMRVFGSDGNVYRVASLFEKDSGEYEIVGIFGDVDSYPYWIFLPGLEETGFRATAGYTAGSFRLKNEGAADFIKKAEALESKGFRLTVYDQGYSAATDPMRELLFTAIVFLAVCLLLAAAALLLQSRVFVSRQRETALTMRKLGTGRAQVVIYFLSSALLLTVIAAVSGCVAGRLVESKVIGLMQDIAARYEGQDLRYSVSRLALIRTLDFDPKVSAAVYFAAAGTMILGSALSTLAFALSALGEKKPKKRGAKRSARVREVKSSKLKGPLKYSLLSIRRGLARSLAVLLLAAVAAVFFARLTDSLDGYRAALENYRSSAEITGHGTDLYGRKSDRLLLDPDTILEMMKRDVGEDYAVTYLTGYCTLIGVGLTAEGERLDPVYNAPDTEFGMESLAVSIMHDRKLVSTSSVENCAQFRYAKPEMTWLEGYGETDFLTPGLYCALSDVTMRENGIKLGDSVLFYVAVKGSMGDYTVGRTLMKVIARYSSASTSKTVFWPLRYYAIIHDDPYENYEYWMGLCEDIEPFDPKQRLLDMTEQFTPAEWEQDVTWIDENGVPQTFHVTSFRPETKLSSFTFRLSDNSRLDELRDTLAEVGYTWVGTNDRMHDRAVIEDEVYLNTVHSMERQIEYVTALYYSLYVIVFIIGAALAWLMTASRRREIALMRAIGTQKWRIILNFFMEQVILSAVGLGVGIGISYAIGGVNTFALMLSAAFFGLWCLSALICLTVSLFKRSYAALTEPE